MSDLAFKDTSGRAAAGGLRRPEVADIIKLHGDEYLRAHRLSPEQHKIMKDIPRCRTSPLSGHLMVCSKCKSKINMYNSCRNRHCPKCQSLTQGKWVMKRCDKLLSTHYFHVVMTLPQRLRLLARFNRRVVYSIILKAAGATLTSLLKKKRYLGAVPAVTVVLHTWTRELKYHPHVHCIVSGGGLSLDGQRWVSARQNFLLPLMLISATFRSKVIKMLSKAYKRGELNFDDKGPRDIRSNRFVKLMKTLSSREWISYAKNPFEEPAQVIKYLGRYTQKTGISNQRLISFDNNGVCFYTKDEQTVTIPPLTFIDRFLMHVLPLGFVKTRHYGLYAPSNVNTKLAKAQQLLETNPDNSLAAPKAALDVKEHKPQWMLLYEALTGIRGVRCPKCHQGWLLWLPHLEPALPEMTNSS